MDICNLFESKDMREHLRKIGYKFSTAEAAFLVYVNGSMTIKQKHAAWQEIIDTMPNCSLESRYHEKPIYDFHEFLRKYMAVENGLLESFCDAENSVWQYRCRYDSDDFARSYNDELFYSLQDCLEAAYDDDSVVQVEIKKQSLHDDWIIEYTLNKDKQITKVYAAPLDDERDIIINTFNGMWFDFPTPFKHGDIVVSEYGPFGHKVGGEVFVLYSIDTWGEKEAAGKGLPQKDCLGRDKQLSRLKKNGDITDMVACGYFLRDDGSVYGECMHAYYNLEFYCGELKDEKRVLGALSSYLKGELALDTLLDAYHIYLQQKSVSDKIKLLGVPDKMLKKLGLQ